MQGKFITQIAINVKFLQCTVENIYDTLERQDFARIRNEL